MQTQVYETSKRQILKWILFPLIVISCPYYTQYEVCGKDKICKLLFCIPIHPLNVYSRTIKIMNAQYVGFYVSISITGIGHDQLYNIMMAVELWNEAGCSGVCSTWSIFLIKRMVMRCSVNPLESSPHCQVGDLYQ